MGTRCPQQRLEITPGTRAVYSPPAVVTVVSQKEFRTAAFPFLLPAALFFKVSKRSLVQTPAEDHKPVLEEGTL